MTHRKERTGRRKSDPGTITFRPSEKTLVACELPWGAPKVVPVHHLDYELVPGLFTAQNILIELFNSFEKKLNTVITDEPLEKLINKCLQRGSDEYMDNLIHTLFGISEVCLPSVLRALISWYERKEKEITEKINPSNENRFRLSKKLLAANYLFCLVLIEILPQAEFHANSCEQHINYILNLCFRHVSYKDPTTLGANHTNSLVVAETCAEVIGVLSLTHFSQIHRAFFSQLNELKKDTTSPSTAHNIIALLVSVKFLKIKTNQVGDFEMGIRFLDELGTYFLEVKDKDVKHALAGLLVEILLPVASQIKREANIPALIAFVSKLYAPVNDMSSKKHHKMAAFPLQTCLLCVSQRSFFLQNWTGFLNPTLQNLKNRDNKISRVALESLYRLLWVYMIRIGGDGNTSTRSRLESICYSLFPKGNRAVIPRGAPINIFVKIIHFIAQQKLDFAFREVIFELLGVNRQMRSLYPERMNIGIRALMVIADGLQQKEEPPGMPKNMGPPLASGTMARVKKKTYITRPLTVDVARSIGLEQYYAPCRKAFDAILRILDQQVGKSLMLMAVQSRGKEPEEMTGGDAKPKLDLLRTCVAAIPRLLPDPMSPVELVDILTRISVHVDDELRDMAAQSLQSLVNEFPDWREYVINATLNLLITQLTDTYPVVLDIALRLLIQLVTTWRTAAIAEKKKEGAREDDDRPSVNGGLSLTPSYLQTTPHVVHSIEGFALVMLCQTRPQPKRIAVQLLKECKLIVETLDIESEYDVPVISVLDEATPYVVRKYIEHVPLHERDCWTMDFGTVCEKIGGLETESHLLSCLVNSDRGNEYLQWDPWACALSGYAEHRFLLSRCPSAVSAAWPTLFNRFNAVCGYVDPNNPQNESRASLLRSSKSKASPICGDPLNHESCLSLWQKYVTLCCAFVLPTSGHQSTLPSRSFSPTSSAHDSDVFRSVSSSLRISARVPSSSSQLLFTRALSMIRWENMTDIRDSVVLGVGSMNPHAFEPFLEELHTRGVLREATEKKVETNARRRRRKDLLRLQIIRIIEVAVFRGLLDVALIESGRLNGHLLDFIDATRMNLESDQDRDIQLVTSLRLHLAKLVALIIDSVPPDQRTNLIPDERKQNLFYLFIGWCSRSIAVPEKKQQRESDVGSFVEQKAVVAMSRLLCCGPIFEASKAIGEDGYLYGWLEKVVSSNNHIMEAEAEETLAWMLEMNESSNLLDWLMQQCYEQSARVGARCFRALLRVFSRRECPCEFVSLFVLCQTMCADRSISDASVQMVELLRKRFLDSASSPLLSQSLSSPSAVPFRPGVPTLNDVDSQCLPTEQLNMCRRLAKAYPQLSITVFSEVCSRLDSARPHCQTALLILLLPWMENLELVSSLSADDTFEGPRGYGSEEATQLLLNNLLYITITMGDNACVADLWRALAVAFPANLPAILNYLHAMTVLSHDTLLSHTKRICVLLCAHGGSRLFALLIEQLGCTNDSKLTLERCEMAPFYRWRKDERHKEVLVEAPTPMDEEPREDDLSCEGVKELPMPAYGGHYSPLSRHLPPITQPVQHCTRSQVALLLLCDVIRAAPDATWAEATPRLLHMAILSLDNRLLCRHARQTILHLCLLHADRATLPGVSSLLLNNTMTRSDSTRDGDLIVRRESRGGSPSHFVHATHDEYRQMLLHSNALFSSHTDLISAVVFCLSENMDRPLWQFETTSSKSWRISSASQLTCLVRHLAELLLPAMPLLPVVWTQIAMRMALSVSDRHVAGRCFQISSALCQPPGTWVPSLLARLVETVGESQEETQAYVTDVLLCVMASVPHISPVVEVTSPMAPSISPTHIRSTSYTPALLRQSLISHRLHDRKDARLSLLVGEEIPWAGAVSLTRSKSAEALSSDADAEEDAASTRALVAAIAISLLDSGIENEFLLAIHLLDKILETCVGVPRTAFLQKLEKTITGMEWKSFGGMIGMVTRGAVMNGAYEMSIQVLLALVDSVSEAVVGGPSSFSLIVISVLPYLLFHFDSPNALCIRAAEVFKQYTIGELSKVEENLRSEHPLSHLSTMMSQYEAKAFTKDRLQWTKCVIKYHCDAFNPDVNQLVSLLSEILERGQQQLHVCVLHMMYVLLEQGDSSCSPLNINAQVVRSVSKHIQGSAWRESSRVLKVLVEQWQQQQTNATTDFELPSPLFSSNRPSPPSPRRNEKESATIRRGPPHMRVREHLLSLLSSSGLRVGIANASSVVFSQSEMGSSASSTERICASCVDAGASTTTSIPDPSSIGDSYPRVFKEFDFLEAEHDSVSETADSCFGWLSTMRTHSIADKDMSGREDVDDEENDEEGDESETNNGEGNEERAESSCRSHGSTDRTPCASEGEDDEEMDKLSMSLDGLSGAGGRGEVVVVPDEDVSVGGSSVCGRSDMSVDMSSRLPPILMQCEHHLSPHVESTWVQVVSELADDRDGDMTSYATLMLSQLYKVCCGSLSSLLRDALYTFSSQRLARAFSRAQDVVVRVTDCPYLFITAQFLRSSNETLQRMKLSLYEQQGHLDTFAESKEKCIRALNAVKSACKLTAIGGSTTSLNAAGELTVAKWLHRLFFQLMLMRDSLCDMVRTVNESPHAQELSLSPSVLTLQRDLLQCVAESGLTPSGTVSAHPNDSLLLLLANKQHSDAILAVRQLRQAHGVEYGCCENSDVDVLLLLFCRNHTPRAWALVGADDTVLKEHCDLLREANAELASAVRKAMTENPARTSTVSSLADSYVKASYNCDSIKS